MAASLELVYDVCLSIFSVAHLLILIYIEGKMDHQNHTKNQFIRDKVYRLYFP